MFISRKTGLEDYFQTGLVMQTLIKNSPTHHADIHVQGVTEQNKTPAHGPPKSLLPSITAICIGRPDHSAY